jgi:signal transduction histidine kinase
VALSSSLPADLPRVRGDATRLGEVLAELCENARRSMPNGGTLRVTVANPDPRLVTIVVADTGVGMTPDVVARCFDPFFTTKTTWDAQGLGLTMVFRVMEAHGGSVHVDSAPGEGTRVTLSFPSRPEAHLA